MKRQLVVRSSVATALGALFAASSACTAFAAPTLKQIIDQFDAISFSSEHGGEEIEGFFVRWPSTRPVYVSVLGTPHPGLTPVLNELHELTGLRFEPTPINEPHGIVVTYRNQKNCTAKGSPRNFISVTIANETEHRIRHCHLEEFVQSIGPRNDACVYRPTIFCDGDGVLQDYTRPDKIIIRATFDPRLPDFGQKSQVMPIARQVIRELYEKEFGPIRDEDERGAQPDADTEELSLP